MPDIIDLFKQSQAPVAAPVQENSDGTPLGTYDDEELLALWERMKRETFETRWVWERQWQRNLWYILGRQWIDYFSRGGGWREKRLAPTVPRPVTNKAKETLQAITAIFTSINLGVNVRPNGQKPENVSTAAVADELSPVIHESHGMNGVMGEFDFWFVATGNAFLHTFLDYDMKYGVTTVNFEQCATCGQVVPEHERVQGTEPCASCGGTEFTPALDDQGQPMIERRPKGQPMTVALSPLEVAFPNSYTRFRDLPYIVRMRWRTKWYFENHPTLKDLVSKVSWTSSPSNTTLQLYRSLASQNDLGIMPTYLAESGNGSDEEGVTEYEVQMRPCDAYPEGLVFRIVGDESPMVLHLEETEAVPGPLPYQDAEGRPLWTWTHAGYDPVGGRILAAGPIDLMAQKQDQLNQLDSMVMMTLMRLAAGGWIIPKGSEIENITKLSTPGVIVRWNPMTVGGNARPERFEGAQINDSWFKYREQIINDIETLTGTFDIIKGAKPTGVEAFSALQLLVERSQSRFAWPFASRGDAYKDWFKFALELEREFGPNERTEAVLTPARTWTFQTFKRTQLQGSVSIIVEDGSNTPKTSLGMRAAVQQAQALQMLDMTDSDSRYEGLKLFGLQRMVPTLDVHIQAALHKQQAFEEWIIDPAQVEAAAVQGEQEFAEWQANAAGQDPALVGPPPSPLNPTPLKWLPWYRATIHRQEFEKWANSDRVRELLKQMPGAEELLTAHFQELQLMEIQQLTMGQPMPPPSNPGGAAEAMTNSNRESTTGNEPSGTGEGAQGQGPA